MIIIRPWLFIGKYRETQNLPLLHENNIQAMLQFEDLVEQPSILSLYLPITDGEPLRPEILKQGIDFMLRNYHQNKTLFVSCGAGISRSATFIIATLKETENLSLLNAYQSLKEFHPGALPHPALWQSLNQYYQENIPYWQLLKEYNQSY